MSSENNKRIAKNSILLYFRTFITMCISLYTSRLILKTLGIEDFGIYNVVGGVVIMFQLMSGSLSSATQRFLTYEIGKKDKEESNKVFSTALTINAILAISLVVFIEVIGLWILNTRLNIPNERMEAANWIFQFSVIQFSLSLITTTFNASIIAHEKMNVVAYISIFESVLRLIIIVVAFSYISFDKLIIFGLLMLLISTTVSTINIAYCLKNFVECEYKITKDKVLYKHMLGFSGWNLIGSTSHALLTQGTNILINVFFGVALNAARGITVQVEGAINQFVNNFMTALNPQITKYYASKNYDEMNTLMQRGAKFSFFLFFILALPIFLETETILNLWLVNVPNYTVIFIRLNLVVTLIYTLSNTYLTGIFATGEIRRYQLIIALIVFVMFSITYLLLKFGFGPESTYIVYIIIALFVFISRLHSIFKLIGFKFSNYLQNVLIKVTTVITLSFPIPLIMIYVMETSLLRLLIVSLTSVLTTIISIYTFGLEKGERDKITKFMISKTIERFK